MLTQSESGVLESRFRNYLILLVMQIQVPLPAPIFKLGPSTMASKVFFIVPQGFMSYQGSSIHLDTYVNPMSAQC